MDENEKLTGYDKFKGVVEVVVSASVGLVVGHAVSATTPKDLKRFSRIGVKIGGWAIGSALSGLVTKQITDSMDSFADKLKGEIDKQESEVKVNTDNIPDITSMP